MIAYRKSMLTLSMALLNKKMCNGFAYKKINKSVKIQTNNYFSSLTFNNCYKFSEEGDRKKKLQQKFKQNTQQMMKQAPEQEQDQVSYTKSDNKITKYLMALSALAIVGVYVMMEVQSLRAQKKVDKSVTGMAKISSTGKVQIGGDWKLTDTKGKPFGSQDLEGTYYLIYFGFTNCPDVCPNSLIKLARALQKIRKMPQYQYLNIKTVFVSVDPDRDSNQKIEKFLNYFDPSFIGVTGKSNNDPDLKQCMKKFKIYASKIEFEDEDVVKQGRKSYTVDHTIITYLMSDSNEYLTHLGANLGEHDLAKAIVQTIIKAEQQKMQLLKII